jgi:methyl-accepting chemotaxis protein
MLESTIDPFWVEDFPWMLIVGWLLYSLSAVVSRWVRNLNYYIYESIPSTFVTLGLLGTFGGVAYGLYKFDTSPDKIKESIQLLLDGLKTAMYTTIAGVSLSIIFGKIIQIQLKGKRVKVPDSPELLELRALNESFGAFQESMLHNQRNALKDGLETVLQQFNEIMDDFVTQLVEKNFQELSSAVKQLTDWQIEHRADVGALLVYYRELTSNHTVLVENTEEWIKMMDEVAGQSSKLQNVIDEFNDAFSDKGNLSQILRDVSTSTGELKVVTGEFGKLAVSLNETTTGMQVTGDKIDGWTNSIQQASDASGQMVASVSNLRTIDHERLAKLFASIDELFLKYMEDLDRRLEKVSADAE